MAPIGLILWVLAFVLFALATVGVPSPPRFNLLAAGLACIALAELLGRGPLFVSGAR